MANRVGQQLGRYRINRLLGQGSFADVYLGEHLYLKSEAAVKVLHTQLTEEDVVGFLNEAQTIARLMHPNIIRIFDFDVEAGTPYLVMDFAPQGTLRWRHPKGWTVPLQTIVSYVRQLAAALQYAHDQKLVHRDVKPENMLVGRHGEILLSDFGIVQVAQATNAAEGGEIAGTVAYMSPEQFQGKSRFASDQYALGVVVYEWLCGQRPFQGSFLEMLVAHTSFPPPPIREKNPDVPPSVEEVVMVALSKDPRQRFGSVLAFARALEQAVVLASPSTPPTPLPFHDTRQARADQQPAFPALPIPQPSGLEQRVGELERHSAGSLPSSSTSLPAFTYPPVPVQRQPPEASIQQDTIRRANSSRGDLPRRQHGRSMWRLALLFILAVLLVAGTLTATVLLRKPPPTSVPGNPIGVSVAPDGEYIGISDGSFAFDTNRSDGILKRQAAEKLKARDIKGAEMLWQGAVNEETNDAEALIYLEDQRVIDSGHPYITFVVGTLLTGDFVSIGRDDLQGAFVAQKEYNASLKLPGGVLTRLLIANTGNEAAYATRVAQQIVQAAQRDKTIAGVMGWPFNGSTRDAIGVLNAAHIPLVAPTASDDALTGISPYFFRVAPSYERQVMGSTLFAEQRLHARRAAVFEDPADSYSKTLASDFVRQFTTAGNSIVVTENYTTGHPQSLSRLLAGSLRANPDLIYFAGGAGDVVTLLAQLPGTGPFAHLPVMGGDELSGQGSYPRSASNGFDRLYFSEGIATNEWEDLGLSAKKPAFFSEFAQDFDPYGRHADNPHGYSLADNASTLSYDATLALLDGSRIVLAEGKKSLSPDELRQGLAGISGARSYQGASGQISFGPDGDPLDKAVVILRLNLRGDFTVEAVYGNLLFAA